MININSSLSNNLFKQISKDTFCKYKRVRKIQCQIMGEYFLYSKQGVKYIVKQIDKNRDFITTRPLGNFIFHKYVSPTQNITHYIYPIIGIPLQSVLRCQYSAQSSSNVKNNQYHNQQTRQLNNLLKRHKNSLQKVLIHILQYLIKLSIEFRNHQQQSIKYNSQSNLIIPLYLQCLRVHNGELLYCYDSWMNSQQQIVIKDLRNIQMLYLSQTQLKLIQTQIIQINSQTINQNQQKTITFGQIKPQNVQHSQHSLSNKINSQNNGPIILQTNNQNIENAVFLSIYKAFLFILTLGSMELNLRIYEWGQFRLNNQNLQKRLKSFSLKFIKQKQKLPELITKVLTLQNKVEQQKVIVQEIFNYLKLKDQSKQNNKSDFNNNMELSLRKCQSISSKLQLSQSKFIQSGVKNQLNNKKINRIKSFSKDLNINSNDQLFDAQQNRIKAPTRVTLSKKRPNNLNKTQLMQNEKFYSLTSSKFTTQFHALDDVHQQNLIEVKNKFSTNSLLQSQQNKLSIQQTGEFMHIQINQKQSDNINTPLFNSILEQTNHNTPKVPQKQQIQLQKNSFISKQVNQLQKNTNTYKKNNQTKVISKKVSLNPQTQKDKQQVNLIRKSIQSILAFEQDFQTSNQINCQIPSQQAQQIFNTNLISNTHVKLLKLLNLEYYLPKTKYQHNLLKYLANTIVSRNWKKQSYKDGGLYIGETKSNTSNTLNFSKKQCNSLNIKREGWGLYVFPSNDIYFGQWHQNIIQGHGTYIFYSGQVYEGQLQNGKKHGYGKFIYQDGKIYQGFWINDSKIGLATISLEIDQINKSIFKLQQNSSKMFKSTQNKSFNIKAYSSQNKQINKNLRSNYQLRFLGQFSKNRSEDEVEGIFTIYDQTSQQIESYHGCLSDFDNVWSQLNLQFQRNNQNDQQNQMPKSKTLKQQKQKCGLNSLQQDGRHKTSMQNKYIIDAQWKNGFIVEYFRS